MSPPPIPAYHLRARLPRSLAPQNLGEPLLSYMTEILELYFPGSQVTAELAESGPPAMTLADGGVPPRAVRRTFADALEAWRRVVERETEPLPDGRHLMDLLEFQPGEGGAFGCQARQTGQEVTAEEPIAEAVRAGRARRGADGGEP